MLSPRPTHVRHAALVADFLTNQAQPAKWTIAGTNQFGHPRFVGPDGTLSAKHVDDAFLFTTQADADEQLPKYAGAEVTKVYLPTTVRPLAMTFTPQPEVATQAVGSPHAQAKKKRGPKPGGTNEGAKAYWAKRRAEKAAGLR